MDDQESRINRLRHEQLQAQVDNLPSQSDATIKWVGQVYDGGHLPTTADKFYLCYPVQFNGSESEGDTPTLVADTEQSASVLVLNKAAQVGDLLQVFGIAGRWVAELGTPAPSTCGLVTCGSCQLPATDLTVTWHNGSIGDGSTTIFFNGASSWVSDCTNEVIYQILCNAGQVEFRVIYFIDGSCPDGTSNYCSTLGANPLKLTKDSLTCGYVFDMEVSVTDASCPNLYENGYTGFSIKGPFTTPPVCPVCVKVVGICAGAVAGATVTICGVSGTTDSNGFVIIDIGSAGSCAITATAAGYPDYSDTKTLACGQSITIALSTNCPPSPWTGIVATLVTSGGTFTGPVIDSGSGLGVFAIAGTSFQGTIKCGSGSCAGVPYGPLVATMFIPFGLNYRSDCRCFPFSGCGNLDLTSHSCDPFMAEFTHTDAFPPNSFTLNFA